MSDRARIVAEQEVLTLLHFTSNRPKRSRGLGLAPLDPLTDPFRETVLDYAYNLVAGGIVNGFRLGRILSDGPARSSHRRPTVARADRRIAD